MCIYVYIYVYNAIEYLLCIFINIILSEFLPIFPSIVWASQVTVVVKDLLANAGAIEKWVQSLNREDPLEKGMAPHSGILAWRILWTEEPGGLQSMRSQRVEHNWSNLVCTHCVVTWKYMVVPCAKCFHINQLIIFLQWDPGVGKVNFTVLCSPLCLYPVRILNRSVIVWEI